MLKFHKIWNNFLKFISLSGALIVLMLFYYYIPNQSQILSSNNWNSDYTKNIIIKKNYEIAIENSSFKGLSKDLEPYEIHSRYAYKTSNNQYKLDQINAKYLLSDKQFLLLAAKHGIIDDQQKLLYLKDDIELISEGLKIFSNQIDLNLVSKDIESKTPVKIEYKNSIINADSFNAQANNQNLNFKGHVRTKINFKDF